MKKRHKKKTSKKRIRKPNLRSKEKSGAQTILVGLFVILIVATAVVTNYETNCEENEECFNRAFFTCTKAKVLGEQEGSIFEYKILERDGENCIVSIELVEVNPDLDELTKQRFQDKSMQCLLPINEGFTTDKLNLCEGPLKEAIYEVTIQKMYNLLAQNLGEIISQMRQ